MKIKLVQFTFIIGISLLLFSILGFNKENCNDYRHPILYKKMDSIIKYQKTQLDTLVWYNEIGIKIKD